MHNTSPRLRRLALAAIVTNVGIVLTGGVVRLTGSGLGCPDWPTCDGDRIIPSGGGAEAGWHQAIEFGNRLLTFLVLGVAVATFVAAWRRRRELSAEVMRLAAAIPLGVLAQAVLGGITVLTGLHPLVVAAHFLLSMVLVAVAVTLHYRVADTPRGVVSEAGGHRPGVRRLAVALVVVGATVLVLGTIVTAAGPHAGDPGTERLAVDIRDAVRLHTAAVWLTVGITVAVALMARRGTPLRRAAGVLLGLEIAQGVVGYTQYFTGIPEALVAVHLLLASLFWVAAVRVGLSATAQADAIATAHERARASATA